MGYHIVDIELGDGRVFKQVIIDSGFLTQIRDVDPLPFTESDISDVRVTQEKWIWKQPSR